MKFKDLMNSNDDDLTEQAIAMMGDWDAKADMGSKSLFMLNKEWTYIEDLFNMKLYKHNSANAWILGEMKSIEGEEKMRFAITFRIDFSNRKNIGHKFGLKKLYNVDEVGVTKSRRGDGLSTNMYRYFVKNQGYNIIGDEQQFFGARKLWSKLSKQTDITVDIIDLLNEKVLETDTVIHHGDLDEEFDKRVWSYGIDKKHLRLILKDIN
jgi:hypothetical protein